MVTIDLWVIMQTTDIFLYVVLSGHTQQAIHNTLCKVSYSNSVYCLSSDIFRWFFFIAF